MKVGTLWVPVSVELLDPAGNRHGIGDAAILAYLRLLAWCKRHRTDGLIPFSVAPSILNGTAKDLEAAGLIALDDDDHVIIRDWHKWHESADQLAAKRAADRERKRLARERGYVFSSSTRDRDRESGVTPPGLRPESDRTWDQNCEHGAPHNGRTCIECRTGRVID